MMQEFLQNWIYFIASLSLVGVGLYIVLTKENIFRIIVGLNIIESGTNLFMVAIAWHPNAVMPIYTATNHLMVNGKVVTADPLPQSLVLTAIVIGLGTTALALAIGIKIFEKYGTLDVRKIKEAEK